MHHRPHLKPCESGIERWTATLRDGSHVEVRPITPEDADAEREFIQRLSAETRRHRFLEQFRTPDDELLRRLTHVDPIRDAAYVATARESGGERIVAACRFASDPDGGDAECAIVVADAWQQRGLGELLMKHLIQTARDRGLRRLYSVDSSDNADMADLARHLGYTRRADPDEPTQVIHALEL